MAVEEDVYVIGSSGYGRDIEAGGIIPPSDQMALRESGVAAVFVPGTDTHVIVDFIKNQLAGVKNLNCDYRELTY